jgi:hypothetical protein
MDELFLSPSAPVAMPRAYWLDQPFLSSQRILLGSSQAEWQRIEEFMDRDDSGFDMDTLNTLYKDSCLILPHRRYNIITGELRGADHSKSRLANREVERFEDTARGEVRSFLRLTGAEAVAQSCRIDERVTPAKVCSEREWRNDRLHRPRSLAGIVSRLLGAPPSQ